MLTVWEKTVWTKFCSKIAIKKQNIEWNLIFGICKVTDKDKDTAISIHSSLIFLTKFTYFWRILPDSEYVFVD